MKIFLIVLFILLGINIAVSLICFICCFTRVIKTRDMSTEEGVKMMHLDKFKDIIISVFRRTTLSARIPGLNLKRRSFI